MIGCHINESGFILLWKKIKNAKKDGHIYVRSRKLKRGFSPFCHILI
jgi:hypothetical protein